MPVSPLRLCSEYLQAFYTLGAASSPELKMSQHVSLERLSVIPISAGYAS